METQRCTKSWRRYLTSSTLILAVVITLIIFKTIFAIERESERLDNFLKKKVVIQINDEIVVNKSLKTDTLNIYLNKYIRSRKDSIDMMIIDDSTEKEDTIVIDTLNSK